MKLETATNVITSTPAPDRSEETPRPKREETRDEEQCKVKDRPCQTHSFHTDAAEVQYMEKGLLRLLDDFNSGKLRAFGQGCSMEQMERIRDQQENLARLHFELGSKQDMFSPLSEEGIRIASENMDKLMQRLEVLSESIGKLNPRVPSDSKVSWQQEEDD